MSETDFQPAVPRGKDEQDQDPEGAGDRGRDKDLGSSGAASRDPEKPGASAPTPRQGDDEKDEAYRSETARKIAEEIRELEGKERQTGASKALASLLKKKLDLQKRIDEISERIGQARSDLRSAEQQAVKGDAMELVQRLAKQEGVSLQEALSLLAERAAKG